MRLQFAEIDNVFPTARGRWKVRYSTLVIAFSEQKASAASTVLKYERSGKCGKWVL